MRKIFKQTFCLLAVVFLVFAACNQALFGFKGVSNVAKLTSDVEDLSGSGEVSLLDANNNKIVDSLEREI